MHGEGFFYQAFVYLAAAVVAVPIAKRLGLGSVLGYLIAGIAIGPFGLGLVGEEGQDVMHFAEFGVVMMLFLIGLELQPALLWRLRGADPRARRPAGRRHRRSVIAGVGLGARTRLADRRWPSGMILALSSTAIVLQTLQREGPDADRRRPERFRGAAVPGHRGHPDAGAAAAAGRRCAGDLVAGYVGATAITPAAGATRRAGSRGFRPGRRPWSCSRRSAAIVAGRALPACARSSASSRGTRLREMFTAAALLLVIGIALLMSRVGLSPALGTFLAGVVLANSEYRHELESDIEPFKGLLLGAVLHLGRRLDRLRPDRELAPADPRPRGRR